MSPVENDGFSIFIFWSSREEAKSKRLVNVSHAMFALKYSHWNVNGLFLFLFRLWKLNLFKFLLLQLLFLDDNKLHSKSKVRSLEMTILRSPWDQKWACPNLLRRENDWNQSMKSFRNEISHDMEAEKYEAALNNICKTLLHCLLLQELRRRRKKNRRLSFKKVARHFQMARMMTGLKIRSTPLAAVRRDDAGLVPSEKGQTCSMSICQFWENASWILHFRERSEQFLLRCLNHLEIDPIFRATSWWVAELCNTAFLCIFLHSRVMQQKSKTFFSKCRFLYFKDEFVVLGTCFKVHYSLCTMYTVLKVSVGMHDTWLGTYLTLKMDEKTQQKLYSCLQLKH